MRFSRSCGVLLHPTSLPGPFGIGDLGPSAHRYIEWLAGAGVSWWQILPLNPTGPGFSPYAAISSFAANPLLISPELLVRDGLVAPGDLEGLRGLPDFRVDFERLVPARLRLLRRAHERLQAGAAPHLVAEGETFRHEQRAWVEDFALFAALKDTHAGLAWRDWPTALALHQEEPVARWASDHRQCVDFHVFCQAAFDRQWRELRSYAANAGVSILGDVPIFVAHDSADVWAHRELFQLDEMGLPTVVAGVPPDYFSRTGQLWGNPLYDWPAMERAGFAWWVDRLRTTLRQVDAVRLDHFRGFAACWEVPSGEETAMNGRWVPGPGRRLFDAVAALLGELPLVAEDLGIITEDVSALRQELALPGMAILQFAFNPSERSTFLPYSHRRDLVVYTGTHDNNTSLGWFLGDATEGERSFLQRYLATDGHEVHWDLIRAALASVADLAVVPHQDIAGLGGDCRMNTPGCAEGNWRFRITDWMLSDWHQNRLADLVWLYGRSPQPGRR